MLWLRWIKRFFGWIIGPALLLLTLGIIGLVFVWAYYTPQLPSEDELRNSVSLQLPLRVYSKEKKLIAEFGQYRRRPVKIEEVPKNLTNAFIAIEDSRFYEHKGVDFYGVARAFVSALKTRKVSQGASTITMQVARNFFLDRRKKLERKIKEIFLASKIETIFSKDEIMELYLNKIFLGKRSYGVGSAAEVYYGTTVNQLTLAQSAMIAGLPKAPSAYNPVINPKRAKTRRDYILKRMHQLDYISQSQYDEAVNEPLTAKIHARAKTETAAPYIAEMVRRDVIRRFGEDLVYRTGMKVYTTIDSDEQENAVSTLRKHLISYHKRHGYRGPEDHIELDEFSDKGSLHKKISSYPTYSMLVPAVVIKSDKDSATLQTSTHGKVKLSLKKIKWARKYISENRRGKSPKKVSDVLKAGDIVRVSQNDDESWSLTPLPLISGAIVSMNPDDGAVLSAVGGFDYHQSKFNRATQAKRQPGSSFKPFIYSSALAKGYSPASVVNDAPVDIPGSSWKPENYSGKNYGPTRLRYGLKKSRNLVSIQLLREIGIDYAENYVSKFGFNKDEIPNDLTMALGTGSVTPMQLAGAYSTFANGGFKVEPYFITHIADHEGDTIFRYTPNTACRTCTVISEEGSDDVNSINESNTPVNIAPRIMKPYVRYQIVSMLQSVARSGTAVRTRSLNRTDIAGKTGTTNDQKDAWFAGFTPKKVAIVWMGFDQIHAMGRHETAASLALPTWITFMKKALKDVPQVALVPPKGMLSVSIDGLTGFIADEQSIGVFPELLTREQIPGKIPRDFAYNTNIIRVNNPTNPTIDLSSADEELVNSVNSQTGTHVDVNNVPTRTIIIDDERFEIPEQLF